MNMPSFFRIGLLVVITAIGISAYFFLDAEKIHESFILDMTQTKSATKSLTSQDIGFYKVYTPDFKRDDTIFVQVLDPSGNIIADKKIKTKMAINYFDINQDGTYTVKATNLSENIINFEIEFGQTNSSQILYPGIAIFVGMILVIISTYRKLKNYNIAQPDENIS